MIGLRIEGLLQEKLHYLRALIQALRITGQDCSKIWFTLFYNLSIQFASIPSQFAVTWTPHELKFFKVKSSTTFNKVVLIKFIMQALYCLGLYLIIFYVNNFTQPMFNTTPGHKECQHHQ
jgi:hypothetical protein